MRPEISLAPPVRYAGDPDQQATVPGILRARAELTPDAPWLTFGANTRTFGQMFLAAEQTAAALAALGIGRGDKVAALLPNSTEILDVWFGAALLGAVFVPINIALKGEGLRYIVEHSEASFIALDGSLIDVIQAAVPVGSGPRHRYVRGGADLPPGYHSLEDLLGGSYPPIQAASVSPGDLASVLYTSGTTGLPKGVMNCHNSLTVPAYEYTRRYVRVRADDVLYTSLPLFHLNAQALTTLGAIVSGRPMILAPRFSASSFFDEIRAHNATVFNYIGAMLTILFKRPERDDDAATRLRLAVGGAAPVELWRKFEERFGLELLEVYGLTESGTFCLGSPPDDIRVGKIGRPTSWSEVKILTEDGSDAADGEPGEIVLRSKHPNVMFLGYHRNSEATEKAMEGGWFHTGDRGVRDADGYFQFIDRLKDCIRRRGENISSFEIERAVNSHPDVIESAVVGVPSELGEEDVMVVVVPRASGFDCESLHRYCQEHLATFMVPRYIRVVNELPKTATQRVEKYSLREAGIQGAWDQAAHAEASRTANAPTSIKQEVR